ncbi:hypothetical protein HYW94_00530 [Candidatus Uhrbacteria bacterium]|nr:hypothetical protein [Candidatus Uhrbacteria bacterium]
MKEKKILHKHVFFFGLLIGGGLFFYSFFTFNKSTAIAANQCTISDETNACAEVSSYLDCPSIDGNEEDCTNSDAGSRSCWDATDGLFKCRSSAYFAALPKPAGSNLKFDCLAGANSYKKGDTILSSEKITCNWYAVQAICDSDITTTTGGAVIDSTTNNFTKASGKWNDGSADYASCNWDDTSTDTDEAGTQPACSSKKDDGSDGVVDGVAYGVAETDPGEQSCSRSKISSVACTVESGKDPITQKKACRKCTVGAPAWGTGTEYSLVSEEECPENGKVVSLTRIFTRKVGISDCGPYKVEDSSITCAASCGTPDINTNDENYVAGEGYGYTCGKWSDCQISETGKQSRTCERAGYCSSAKTLTQERTCIAADKCEPQNTRDDAQGTDGKTYYTCNEWDASACRADVDERESIKRQYQCI